MKRTLATVGVMGLAAFAVAAPATATGSITVCHANNSGSYSVITIPAPGLNGHEHHPDDIIPPNEDLAHGQNWNLGSALHGAGCVAVPAPVVPPVVVPPIVVEPPVVVKPPGVENPGVENPVVVEIPPVEPPAVTPVLDQPPALPPAAPPVAVVAPAAAPAAAAPRGAVQRPAAPAATSLGTNQGYNAQTAVGSPDGSASWLAGLGALAAAVAAVAVRRRSRLLQAAG